MSHAEEDSLSQYWKDLPNQDAQERRWLEGARISLQNIVRGGPRNSREADQLTIERPSAADWWKGASQRGAVGHADSAPSNPARTGRNGSDSPRRGGQSSGPLRMTFGKYKAERPLAVDIRERDPGYWNWCYENIDWWRKKVDAAGLNE